VVSLVTLRETKPVGLAFLDEATRLLQAARLAEPEGGLWEAADLHWSWRTDQHKDPGTQSIWVDGDEPVIGLMFSKAADGIDCDPLGSDSAIESHRDMLWTRIGEQVANRQASMIIRDDDLTQIAVAERAGFVLVDNDFVSGWMAAVDRPNRPSLPDGIRIEPYAGGPHPMVARNGEHVAERLAETSLYRRDLDLAVRDGDAVVGYALFWADPVTGVGLVEPMRIEASHQGRGLARALLAEGLDRLAADGCTRLKVTWHQGNEAAARLYVGAGFRPRTTMRTWTRGARS
jgi:GNAT superfamily N-acetyltransferase